MKTLHLLALVIAAALTGCAGKGSSNQTVTSDTSNAGISGSSAAISGGLSGPTGSSAAAPGGR